MSAETRVTRFSVSLPLPLVEEFDKTWKDMQYENRSKAVHDALRSYITEIQSIRTKTGPITGVILVLYYKDKPGLVNKIMTVQHDFGDIVSSTIHLHLERHKCLEIIAVKGSAEEVRRLSQILMACKGVRQVKVAAITS